MHGIKNHLYILLLFLLFKIFNKKNDYNFYKNCGCLSPVDLAVRVRISANEMDFILNIKQLENVLSLSMTVYKITYYVIDFFLIVTWS